MYPFSFPQKTWFITLRAPSSRSLSKWGSLYWEGRDPWKKWEKMKSRARTIWKESSLTPRSFWISSLWKTSKSSSHDTQSRDLYQLFYAFNHVGEFPASRWKYFKIITGFEVWNQNFIFTFFYMNRNWKFLIREKPWNEKKSFKVLKFEY